MNIGQFREIIQNCNCDLRIGGTVLCKYEFKILIELTQIQQAEIKHKILNCTIIELINVFHNSFLSIYFIILL